MQAGSNDYIKTCLRRYRVKYRELSLDAPPPWDPSGRPLSDFLEAS